MSLRSICILVALGFLSCSGDLPFRKGKSQGTIVINTGMKERDVFVASTLKNIHGIGDMGSSFIYGGSDSVFDFVLAGEGLRFNGCILYSFDVARTPDRRVTMLSMHGPNETWPKMVAAILETDGRLGANGWKPIGRCKPIAEWTRQKPGDVPVTDSGTSEVWTWIKGSREFSLEANKHWGGIPWWQNPMRAKVFSRTMGVSTLSDEDLARILSTRIERFSSGSHVFGVRTPPGWSPDFGGGETEGRGYFHPQCRSSASEELSIRLSISRKDGVKLSDRLHVPDETMAPLGIAHPSFASFSRHVSDRADSNTYYVFLDPGENIPVTIELVMYRREKATAEDLAAMDAVVRSIHVIEPEGRLP